MQRNRLTAALMVSVCVVFGPSYGSAEEVSALAAIRAIDKEGQGYPQAIEATRQVEQWEVARLPEVLAAMDGANPLAVNWLRGLAESIAARSTQLPTAELQQFLDDTSHHPRARRLAYEFIVRQDPEASTRLVPGWVNDPALELRRDAVAWLIERADQAQQTSNKDEAVRLFREAFAASRDIDQVQDLVKKLRDLEQPADPARHLGFLRSWYLIGPFDNTNKQGFDVAYPPEQEVELAKKYPGKQSEVGWVAHTTEDDYGLVDLNTALGKHKGAIAFAWTEFTADKARDVELRLGCINANKIWLNGELLTSNHVYHANMFIDQYVGRGRLKAGRNEILVLIAQNEQTEPWAQDWKFQLRVCDDIGTAVLPAGSDTNKVSARIPRTR